MPSKAGHPGATHILALLALFLLSCSSGRVPATANAPAGASTDLSYVQPKRQDPSLTDPAVEDQVLVSVNKALRGGKLLARPDQCYAYRFDAAAGQPAYTVDVRENNSHSECGGDPQTQPHLFTVRVDKTTRALSDDAKTPGVFLPLNP